MKVQRGGDNRHAPTAYYEDSTARARIQKKRGKGASLKEADLAKEEDYSVTERFRSGNKSKRNRK